MIFFFVDTFDGIKNEGVFVLKAKMQLHNSLWYAHLHFITSFVHSNLQYTHILHFC